MSVARRHDRGTNTVSRTLQAPAAGSAEPQEDLREGTPDPEQRGGRIPLREIEFCAWVAQAGPGEIFEYHRGFLAIDRTRFGHRTRQGDRKR